MGLFSGVPAAINDACASSCTPKYHILPFYKMNKQSALARRDKEAYFIQKFKPALNIKV